jgi:DNA repair protein RecN (Recombination protein N)
MLQKLSIKNYTLISAAEIAFRPGFTAITGETGAGKSILLGALSLILGRRADPSVLMDPSAKCVVEGLFDISNLSLHAFFEENELDYDPQTLLRREINPAGKSRAFINDTPVNLNLLKSLGNRLVDIHSQHQTLLLNESGFQLELFDAYVNKPSLLQAYRNLYTQYRESQKRKARLQAQNEQAKRDEDYFRFQLNELESALLDAEELSVLEEKNKLLSHAAEIKMASEMAADLLQGEETSVLELLSRLKETFSRLAGFHKAIADFSQRLDSSYIELADLAAEIENFISLNEFDAAEMQQVEERLDLLYSLLQKHHVNSVSELIALREEYRQKLENISGLEEELQAEEQQLATITRDLGQAAEKLHAAREKKIPSFEKEIIALLKKLGMKEAQFQVQLTPAPDFTLSGKETLTFTFNANKGGTLSSIAKTASGGELSRLMLAIKSLVHQAGVLPTIIFDEIDAGVSGEIAGKLGTILKKMSQQIQVISITHLPQIASRADTHLKVYKHTQGNQTVSEIALLDTEQRLEEIAKMLSDEKITAAARAAASELLKAGKE